MHLLFQMSSGVNCKKYFNKLVYINHPNHAAAHWTNLFSCFLQSVTCSTVKCGRCLCYCLDGEMVPVSDLPASSPHTYHSVVNLWWWRALLSELRWRKVQGQEAAKRFSTCWWRRLLLLLRVPGVPRRRGECGGLRGVQKVQAHLQQVRVLARGWWSRETVQEWQ